MHKTFRHLQRPMFFLATMLVLVAVAVITAGSTAAPVLAANPPSPSPAAKNGDAKTNDKASDKTGDSNSGDSGSAQTQGAVEGHSADQPLQIGTIVQLAGSGTAKVAPATYDKASQMYGVVIDERELSVTVSNADLPNQLYVATGGTHDMLVSTQNGPIKSGDYVTISAVDGIGMLAQPEQKTVFGRALANFDGKTNVIGTAQLKDTTGKAANKVAFGRIPVVIDIRRNPDEKSTKANVPQFLQRLGEAIAEKPVGPLRIYLSILITGVCVVAAIVLLYSGVRNALISIGRNPLSKKSIFRALAEVILTALIVLITGLFAVYLLLKL